MKDPGTKLNEFAETVSRLRQPDGCPWDRAQTPSSLKKYLIEEAYELIEAIDSDDTPHVLEELGDLLFLVTMLARIYSEKNLFSLADVIEGIKAKMTSRHPHVFGGKEQLTAPEQRQRWQQLKAAEGRGSEPGSTLRSLPRTLPALQRAQRVIERASRAGFPGLTSAEALAGMNEKLAALQPHQLSREFSQLKAGELFFALAGWCLLTGLNAEETLTKATDRFIDRFTRLEADLAASGEKGLAETDRQTLLDLWHHQKND